MSCKENKINQPKNDLFYTKISAIEEELSGTFLKCTSSILNDSTKRERLIYLISQNDCGPCVTKGFDIFREIRNKSLIACYVVGSNVNIGLIQIKNNFNEWIYENNESLMRKELKYCFTPGIIHLDENDQIVDIFHPLNYLNQESRISTFVKNL